MICQECKGIQNSSRPCRSCRGTGLAVEDHDIVTFNYEAKTVEERLKATEDRIDVLEKENKELQSEIDSIRRQGNFWPSGSGNTGPR